MTFGVGSVVTRWPPRPMTWNLERSGFDNRWLLLAVATLQRNRIEFGWLLFGKGLVLRLKLELIRRFLGSNII